MSLIPDGKALFSASLLQFSVSHILEIILICCSRNISYYYHRKLKNCCTVYIFVESFRIFRMILWMSKELNFNKYKSFETMYISLLSLFINLMHPCWIKVLIIVFLIFLTPNFWMSVCKFLEPRHWFINNYWPCCFSFLSFTAGQNPDHVLQGTGVKPGSDSRRPGDEFTVAPEDAARFLSCHCSGHCPDDAKNNTCEWVS